MNKQDSNSNSERSVRTRYMEDVLTQPQALRNLINAHRSQGGAMDEWGAEWERSGRPPIVFTGMGASLFAAELVQAYLMDNGIFTLAVPTSDLVDQLQSLPKNALLIAISQSGESIEMKELMERHGSPRLYTVTNVPDSFLAGAAHRTALLELPPDLSVAIKTYTGTLCLLMLLAARLIDGSMQTMAGRLLRAADVIEEQMPQWEKEAIALADRLGRPRFTSFMGRGFDQYTARGASLLFKEGAKLPAEGSSGAQFRHGAVEVVDQEHVAVYFVPPQGDRRFDRVQASVTELANMPGRVVTVGAATAASRSGAAFGHLDVAGVEDPVAMAVAGIVPVQLLTAYLAKSADLEAGQFRNTTPVISHDA